MHQLERVEHGHHAQGVLVQVLAHAVFEQGDIDQVVVLGHADLVDEIADRFGRIAAPAHPAQGGHARVVPAAHVPAFDQLLEEALAQDGVGQVEAGEFDLAGVEDAQLLEEPVVQRAVVFVVQVAQRMGDALRSSRTARGRSRTSGRCTTCSPVR